MTTKKVTEKTLPTLAPEALNFAMLNTPIRFCFNTVNKRQYIQITAGIMSVDIPVSLKRTEEIVTWFEHVREYLKTNG